MRSEFLEQLASPRATVTESRLSSIATQLSQLAVDTDRDATRRLEQLRAQRERIDAQIEWIRSGDLETLEPGRALERVRDILAQAEEILSKWQRNCLRRSPRCRAEHVETLVIGWLAG